MESIPQIAVSLTIIGIILIIYRITSRSRNWSKYTWRLFLIGMVVLATGAGFHLFLCRHTFGEWACLVKKILYISGAFITVLGLMGWAKLTMKKVGEFELRSKTDRLTGLLNRDGIISCFNEVLNQSPVFLLILADLDGTKEVNDNNGHLIGDWFIAEAAREIKSFFGPNSISGRYGGDEFIIILNDENSHHLEDRLIDLKKAIQKNANKLGIDSRVGISMGCARYPEDGVHFDQLLHVADRRMYSDKAKNKNR